MGLSFRFPRPWAPLLAALALSAPAAEPAAAAVGGVPLDRSSAKALAILAQGLCFSASSQADEAERAFLQAIELDPALFAAREGLAELQRRKEMPRLAVRTLLEGARATNRREDWRSALGAALEFAFSRPEEAGPDLAMLDRQAFREAVEGFAAGEGELSARDEALLSACLLRIGKPMEAVRHFQEHARKLPRGAAPSGPLFEQLMLAVHPRFSFLPPAERGPLAAAIVAAMLAATPDWNREATARLITLSLPADPEMAPLSLAVLPEVQRMNPGSSLPTDLYVLRLLSTNATRVPGGGLPEWYRKTEAPTPDVAFHLRLLSAEAFLHLGRTEEALDEIRAARSLWVENHPNEPLPTSFASALATFHWKMGDTNAAVRAYEVGLADHPADPGLNNDLAYLLAEANRDLDRALAMADAALAAEPLNAAFLDTLAWILHRQGHEQEAFNTLRKAVNIAPAADPELFAHIAAVLDAMGRPDEAAAWRRRIDKDDFQPGDNSNEK